MLFADLGLAQNLNWNQTYMIIWMTHTFCFVWILTTNYYIYRSRWVMLSHAENVSSIPEIVLSIFFIMLFYRACFIRVFDFTRV